MNAGRKNSRTGKGQDGRRRRLSALKLAATLLGTAALACLLVWSENEHNRNLREYDRGQAVRRAWERRLNDSLEAERQKRIREAAPDSATPGRRRAFREQVLKSGREPERAPELLEKYNRGGELTPHEEDIVREYYWQDYYDDPDDEGDYPSEIFDDREDYSEEHVRGNFGVAGED